jgi:hypothetical protein
MPLFKRKKVERPKNPLGVALFQYDNILKKEIGQILKALSSDKKLKPSRTDAIIKRSEYKLNGIIDDISKENLKIDYRSDKTRYMIIKMIDDLKKYLVKAKEYDFDGEKLRSIKDLKGPEKIGEDREKLKEKMKDIESDYL